MSCQLVTTHHCAFLSVPCDAGAVHVQISYRHYAFAQVNGSGLRTATRADTSVRSYARYVLYYGRADCKRPFPACQNSLRRIGRVGGQHQRARLAVEPRPGRRAARRTCEQPAVLALLALERGGGGADVAWAGVEVTRLRWMLRCWMSH